MTVYMPIIIYLLINSLILKRSCLSLLIQNSSHDRLLLRGRSGILWSDRSAGSRHGGLRWREHRARHAGRNHFIPFPLLDLHRRSRYNWYLMCLHLLFKVILIGYMHLFNRSNPDTPHVSTRFIIIIVWNCFSLCSSGDRFRWNTDQVQPELHKPNRSECSGEVKHTGPFTDIWFISILFPSMKESWFRSDNIWIHTLLF